MRSGGFVNRWVLAAAQKPFGCGGGIVLPLRVGCIESAFGGGLVDRWVSAAETNLFSGGGIC